MMNAMLFCEECGAANSSQVSYCFACHKLLSPSSSTPSAPATFTQVPVGNGKIVYQLAEPEETPQPVGPLPTGFVLNNRYKIIKQVGQGGFGIVYKARDKKHFNRLVAVKQINLDNLSPRDIIQATDSYNREVKLQAQLNHKHIPVVYQHFTDPKHWYIIMEFVKGETLEEYLARTPGGKLSEREVIRIGMQLCKVLDYLHTKHGIIFRDVKPANIMRTRRGHLYLIDFGIARRYAKRQDKDTMPLGSPGYAAPEQYGLKQTSAQTDIYGLGATLLTLLTGTDLSENTLTPAPPLPQRIQPLLDAMLEREVYKRPATMEDVRVQLLFLSLGTVGKFLYQARSVVTGMFLGCVPFLLYYSFYLSSPSTAGGTFANLSCISPLVALALFISAITFLFKKRQRLMGLCILGTMILLLIILIVGSLWVPWSFG